MIATYEKKHAELEDGMCDLKNQLDTKTTTLTTTQAELETFKKLQLTHKVIFVLYMFISNVPVWSITINNLTYETHQPVASFVNVFVNLIFI